MSSSTSSLSSRTNYTLPLTQEQKDLINKGKAAPPTNEKNTFFDNTIHGLCGNKSCESAVESWWSSLSSVQLISSSDFKTAVNICNTCSGITKCTTILKSLSQFQPIDAIDSKKHKVKLYEIRKKT